jgi:hypothetical protein
MNRRRNRNNKDNFRKNKQKQNESENIERRINIIKEILQKYGITEKNMKPDEIKKDFYSPKNIYVIEIQNIFKDLKKTEIGYIINLFYFAKENNIENIINVLDTINTILCHYEYYQRKNPRIKYNNSHFDNYLLKRYDCAYIFTNYLIDIQCRELKIDNKLFFNYFPVKCPFVHLETVERDECPYAHKKIEELYHPFVYKKFKCPKENCKDENCSFYHVNENDEPIDRETEVDFYSDEIMHLQELLSSLKLNKEDAKKNEKLEIYVEKKADFIPSEFNPKTYKIYPCPLGSICKLEKRQCLNYHDIGDKRRNPKYYKAVLCPNLYEKNKRKKNAKCKNNDKCEYSHNFYEYYYHPDKFRTVKCPQEKNNEDCNSRLICPYTHKDESDLGKGDEERMILNKELMTKYYKIMLERYEDSIDKQRAKYEEIESKYCCYICGKRNTNALNEEDFFLIDPEEHKIICEDCAEEKEIKPKQVSW